MVKRNHSHKSGTNGGKKSSTFGSNKVAKRSNPSLGKKMKATKHKDGLLSKSIDAILVSEGLLPGKAQTEKLLAVPKKEANAQMPMATEDEKTKVEELMDQLGGL
ncbi:hypothetical protein BDD12DRAFT_859803 [Trichophaea hybrida]|nr:hypothetical protein BDD12DRAFT_859803 [Trichophaea hybrida]